MGQSLKEKFWRIGTEIWKVYHSKSKQEFSVALETLRLWAKENITEHQRLIDKIEDMSNKSARFSNPYDFDDCYRTSNQIDRPMNILGRYLYQSDIFMGIIKPPI